MNRCIGVSYKVGGTCLESWWHGEESSKGDQYLCLDESLEKILLFHMSTFLEATKRIQVLPNEEEKEYDSKYFDN